MNILSRDGNFVFHAALFVCRSLFSSACFVLVDGPGLILSFAVSTKQSNIHPAQAHTNPIINRPQGALTLDEIDLRIEPGQLVGIVGPVGSSKSSLLMAVLREIAPERARVQEAGVGASGFGTEGADDRAGEVRTYVVKALRVRVWGVGGKCLGVPLRWHGVLGLASNSPPALQYLWLMSSAKL